MPRTKTTNGRSHLDTTIRSIVSRAIGDIAAAVRGDIAQRVQGIIGPERAAGGKSAGRKPRAGSTAAPRGRGRRGRGVSEADLEKVLAVIGKKPGLRTEQIYGEVPIGKDMVVKALAKLRESGKVKTKGLRRATTYSLA